MDHVELLQKDKQRHSQAIAATVHKAPLLGQQLINAHLLDNEDARDLAALRLLGPRHGSSSWQLGDPTPDAAAAGSPPRRSGSQGGAAVPDVSDALLLMQTAKLRHAGDLQARLLTLTAEAEALRLQKAAVEKDEERLRFSKAGTRKLSLAKAIADDERLKHLTEEEILEEMRADAQQQRKLQMRLASRREREAAAVKMAAESALYGGGGGMPGQGGLGQGPPRAGGSPVKQQQQQEEGGTAAEDEQDEDEDEYEDEEEEEEEEAAGEEEEEEEEDAAALSKADEEPVEVRVEEDEEEDEYEEEDEDEDEEEDEGPGSDQATRAGAAASSSASAAAGGSKPARAPSQAGFLPPLPGAAPSPRKSRAGAMGRRLPRASTLGRLRTEGGGGLTRSWTMRALRSSDAGGAPNLVGLTLQQLRAAAGPGQPMGLRSLQALVGAVSMELPVQQQQLAALKRSAIVLKTQLVKPEDKRSNRDGGHMMTAYQRNVREMMQSLLWQCVDAAMVRVEMRPDRARAAREAAELTANWPITAGTLARQFGESILREVVDELILDCIQELSARQAETDSFAVDLIVGAVAFARGAHTRSMETAGLLQPNMMPEEGAEDEEVYFRRRAFGKAGPTSGTERGLYLRGLQGMLGEMRRKRPPHLPYGHTQQLAVNLRQGTKATKAQRLLLGRLRPPLAAARCVWRARQEKLLPLAPGTWAGVAHLEAAGRERHYWRLVTIKRCCMHAGASRRSIITAPPALGPITATAACPNGGLLALGTAGGGLVVWDMRYPDVKQPWFQIQGNGTLYRRPWWPFARRPPKRPAVLGLAWSADSYQLATWDASSQLRCWWMRPEAGQQVAELEAKRQPVLPELALHITPLHVSISGRVPLEEPVTLTTSSTGTAAAADTLAAGKLAVAADLLKLPARQWRPVFAPSFTITGTQPVLVLPQVTGDILRLHTRLGGRVLPGFGPSSHAEAVNPAAAPLINPGVVEWLMPPQMKHPDILAQALYRCHDAPVVFVGYLADGASLLSADARGVVALWPASDAARTGYGWFTPKQRWQLPRAMRACQARGGLHVVWRPPNGKLRPPSPPRQVLPGAESRGWWPWQRQKKDAGPARIRYVLDQEDAADQQRLQHDAKGSFLTATRAPWLVRYRWSQPGGKGILVRDEYHRPTASGGPALGAWAGLRGQLAAGGGAAAAAAAAAAARARAGGNRRSIDMGVGGRGVGGGGVMGGSGSKAMVVSSYEAETGDLLLRAKQRCAIMRQAFRVQAAHLTPSRRDLLLFCHFAGQQDDPDSFPTLSVVVLNLATMKVLVPRIDVPDPSYGTAPPAYALTPTLDSLGSEYLIIGLGPGVLGVFSLATGQRVRDMPLGVACPLGYFSGLDVFQVREGVNSSDRGAGGSGRWLLAATAAGSQEVVIAELGLGAAGRQWAAQKDKAEKLGLPVPGDEGGGAGAAPVAGRPGVMVTGGERWGNRRNSGGGQKLSGGGAAGMSGLSKFPGAGGGAPGATSGSSSRLPLQPSAGAAGVKFSATKAAATVALWQEATEEGKQQRAAQQGAAKLPAIRAAPPQQPPQQQQQQQQQQRPPAPQQKQQQQQQQQRPPPKPQRQPG